MDETVPTPARLSLEQRVDRLESAAAIDELAVRYCRAVDERDLGLLATLFTTDAVLRQADGAVEVTGWSAIESYFVRRFAAMGVSYHYVHGRELAFTSSDDASGFVNAHAEIGMPGDCMVAAIRYADRYRRDGGTWRFASRELRFWYALPATTFASTYGVRRRKLWEGESRPAELPAGEVVWPGEQA